jgi:hypothetical protein
MCFSNRTISTNDHPWRMWLKTDQQPLKKKGNGWGIHISDWICEPIGRLALSPEQLADQAALPAAARLKVTDTRKIIYPGKNHDAWWDLDQLIEQTKDAVDIFEYLQPNKVGMWLFDCSLAHEGLAADALNINNMNVNPEGKQKLLRETTIPTTNPPPKPGCRDTRGLLQEMVYSSTHPDFELCGKAKGMKAVLQEQESVWDELSTRCNGKVVGKCKCCKTLQAKKDTEGRVAAAEAMGQEDTLTDEEISQADEVVVAPANEWCCMYHVLSVQDDFANEKSLIQHYLEGHRHNCMYLPKFHCELNLIELLWGYAKYRKFFLIVFELITNTLCCCRLSQHI